MFNKFFHQQSKSITSAALVIALASLVSRLLGVLRDRILAGQFGAGDWLDMYYSAFRIPDTVFNLLIMGAISAGFIPVFINALRQSGVSLTNNFDQEKPLNSDNAAWRLVNIVVNVWGILLIGLCLILAILTPYLMPFLAPGFSGEKLAVTINLTRIMFVSPILLGISSIWSGVLQSFKKFFIYSLAPIAYNIGIMIGAIFLAPKYGIYGLAYGVILGAAVHFLIQYPAVAAEGYKYHWLIDLKDRATREIFKLMVPRTLAIAVSQVNIWVITAIASTLASGSIAVFNLANNLQSFPVGIFAYSLAIAALPALSEQAVSVDKDKLVASFSATCRQILFLMIPASVLFLILRAQIVRTVLGSGLFNWEDTIATADCLAFFSFSLFAQGLNQILVRVFYSFKNTKTPFWIGAFSAILNVFFSFYFAGKFGVVGLAAAFSISAIINLIMLWAALKLTLGYLAEWEILVSLVKIIVATLNLGLATQLFKYIAVHIIPNNTFVGIFFQGLSAGLAGIIFFVITGWLLQSEELRIFTDSLRKRLIKTAPAEKLDI